MPEPQDLANRADLLQRAHFMGIGGAGMSGIARILLARGAQVSGSDAVERQVVLSLRAQGAVIGIGQSAANLDAFPEGPTAVVISTAIRADNPELVAARERGIPVLHRAEALAAVMEGYRVACITGSHGKSSTTSMLTVALQHCRVDPSFAIGGDLNESGSNAHHGSGDIFIAEADESDGSFLAFSPSVAVVTNIEADHLDQHGSAEAYTATFTAFLDRIASGGVLIACVDDHNTATLAKEAEAKGIRVRRYGRHANGTSDAKILSYTPHQTGGVTTVSLAGEEVTLRLAIPGEHMAFNAVAALLAGMELDASRDELIEGLAAFGGVRRRFEFKGRAANVRVYDDYAHHPTEVQAQLKATREQVGNGRIVVVFQPHLYSRTKAFAAEFAAALSKADEVVVLDVFAAREEPEPGVSGALIAQQISGPPVHYEPAFDRAAALVADLARPGDLVITMGAGDVTQLGPEILAALDNKSAG